MFRHIFSRGLWAGVLFAMIALAYIPAMRGGFIWDDDSYVTLNPTLKTFDGLRKIWFDPESTPQYYPLVFTSFWAQYQLWETKPLFYHFVNVLLHALNAVLLWRILLRLRVNGAWMAAAIFALHPVHLESVGWITERKNVLSGFFYLYALLIYLRFSLLDDHLSSNPASADRNLQASGIQSRSPGLFLIAMGLFACALLSKTVTCTLPAVILLLLWWKRGRVHWRDVWALIPLFILGAGFATVTMWMEKYHVAAQGEEWVFSAVERCLIAGRALWFYAGKLVWPFPIVFIYPRWQIDSEIWWQYLFPLMAWVVVGFLWLIQKRKGKGPLVAVLVFGGTLAPALGFVNFYPMRFSFVADHFQYLASIAIIALCVACAKGILDKGGANGRRVGFGLGVGVLVIFGVLVWNEGHKYRNAEALWSDTIAKNPQCWIAHNGLGAALTEQGKISEAIRHYSEALGIKPDYEVAHYNLGVALERQGRDDEAIRHYSEALRIDPGFSGLRCLLGTALEKQGRIDEALGYYSEELQINPDFLAAHMKLGNALAGRGEFDKAIRHYSEALRINHDFAGAQDNLKKVIAAKSKFDQELAEIQGELKLNPSDPVLYYRLGNLYKRQGKLDAAADQYQKALSLQPGLIGALHNLAVVYTINRKYDNAIGLFKKAIEIEPDRAAPYYNIACLYALQNNVEESIDWLKKAIERGYKNWNLIRNDKDLENIRGSSYYKEVVKGR
jgi:tetratricopeptide (TPR) repeat protein